MTYTKKQFEKLPGIQFVTSYTFRQNFRLFIDTVITQGPVVICNGETPRAVLMDLEGLLTFFRSKESPYRDLPVRKDPAEVEHSLVQEKKESAASYELPLTDGIGKEQLTSHPEHAVIDGIRYFVEGDQVAATIDATFVSLEDSLVGYGQTRAKALADLTTLQAFAKREDDLERSEPTPQIESDNKGEPLQAAPTTTTGTPPEASGLEPENPPAESAPVMEATPSDEGEEVAPKEVPLCQVNILNPEKSCTFGADEGTAAPAVKRVVVTANGTVYPECNVCQTHYESLLERVKVEDVGAPV